MKTLDPVMEAALEAENVSLLTAVYLDVSATEQIHVHSGVGNYTIDGNVYTGVGDFGSIEAISKDGSTSPEGLQMTLSGLDTSLVSSVLLDGYQGREVVVRLCILVNDYEDIYSHIVFKGRLNTMNIDYGETATITVEVTNRLIDWQRGDVSRWNDSTHQRTLPAGFTDKFFEFVEQTADKEIQFDPYIDV